MPSRKNRGPSDVDPKSASSDSKLVEAPKRKCDPASESSVSKTSKLPASDSKLLDVKIEEDDDDEKPAGGGVNEGAASA